MFHVVDVINFVFFCMHALHASFVQRQVVVVVVLSLKRRVTAPVGKEISTDVYVKSWKIWITSFPVVPLHNLCCMVCVLSLGGRNHLFPGVG
jgi:hypothetical protein